MSPLYCHGAAVMDDPDGSPPRLIVDSESRHVSQQVDFSLSGHTDLGNGNDLIGHGSFLFFEG